MDTNKNIVSSSYLLFLNRKRKGEEEEEKYPIIAYKSFVTFQNILYTHTHTHAHTRPLSNKTVTNVTLS